jgi:hypothetical protein
MQSRNRKGVYDKVYAGDGRGFLSCDIYYFLDVFVLPFFISIISLVKST